VPNCSRELLSGASNERRRRATLRVKISGKHQIAVPASVRRRLVVSADDLLLVEVQDGVIMLIPEPTDPVAELRELGREICEGDDAPEYVDGERDGR
jgi:AbrB family looped-hinge helix DNA binding protein